MRSSLRLVAGLLCVVAPALAVDWKELKPQGYVSDFAHVVDAQSRAEIEAYARQQKVEAPAVSDFLTALTEIRDEK